MIGKKLALHIKDELQVLQDPQEFLRQLLVTWRIALTMIVGELLAGTIGVYLRPLPDAFESFWAAGVLSALPALIAGTLWELGDEVRASSSPRAIRILYFLSVATVLLIGLANSALRALGDR